MKAIAIAVATLLAAGSAQAFHNWKDRPSPWNDTRNGLGWGENRWSWEEERARQQRYYDARDWREPHECWNWQVGTFELVRPGEFQDDLDYGRCRPLRDEYRVDYYRPRR